MVNCCLVCAGLLSLMTVSITGIPLNEGEGGGTTESTVAPTVASTTEEVDYYDDYEYDDTLNEGGHSIEPQYMCHFTYTFKFNREVLISRPITIVVQCLCEMGLKIRLRE